MPGTDICAIALEVVGGYASDALHSKHVGVYDEIAERPAPECLVFTGAADGTAGALEARAASLTAQSRRIPDRVAATISLPIGAVCPAR